MGFSVLMSVYYKESPIFLEEALKSVINQSLLPSEIVLVKDGPLTIDLEETINAFTLVYTDLFKVVALERNLGLGNALKIGIEYCSYEIVARMDTDDISRPNRFETQFNFLANKPHIDIIGTNIEEFDKIPGDLKRCKRNPETHNELIKQIKLKSPFNHPTIMFRKSSLIKAGSYNGDLPLFEDYSLFLRMWLQGLEFYNLQDVLLDFRVGKGIDTIKRRSGIHYLKKENEFLKYAKSIGAFDSMDVFKYKILKFPVRLLPARIVLFIYNTFLRSKK